MILQKVRINSLQCFYLENLYPTNIDPKILEKKIDVILQSRTEILIYEAKHTGLGLVTIGNSRTGQVLASVQINLIIQNTIAINLVAVVQSTVKGKKLTLDLNHIVLKEITIESVEVSITAKTIKIAIQVTKITFQSVKNIKTLRQVKMKQTALNLQQNFPT